MLICKDDEEVREKLICHNLRLVCSIAKRYQNMSDLSFSDLFQFGAEGLIHAIDLYDIGYNTKLSTYASKVIRRYVERGIQKNAGVHVSDGMSKSIWNMIRCEIYLTQQLGCFSTDEQLAEELKISLEELEKRKNAKANSKLVSLNYPYSNGKTLADTIADDIDMDEDVVLQKLRQDVRAALDGLNERERHILILHHGIYNEDGAIFSQKEIADQLGISKQRVQQIENAAMKKLRFYFADYEI